jgi:phosphopantetheinyl transferase (holo-ACP synthase)
MTRAERRLCDTLPTPPMRADYRASRLAAKRAAMQAIRGERALDADVLAPESLRRISVERRGGSPPAVRIREQDGQWKPFRGSLSLAHRDGFAAAAASRPPARVGVDVERSGGVGLAHLRYFANEDEAARGPVEPAALWALKEAAWKALALGAGAPLRSLVLDFDWERRVTAVTVDGRRHRARAALLRPWASHVVSVLRVEEA